MLLLTLETFSDLTLWISSVVPTVLTLSLKLTRPKRERVSFPTNGSIVQRKWTTKNFLPVTPYLSFCALTTPLKKIATTFKTMLTGPKIWKLLYNHLFSSKILFLVIKIFWKDGVQIWLPAKQLFDKCLKTCLPNSENISGKKVLLNQNLFPRKNFYGHVE